MRIVFAILALVMLLFAALQYNDPDGPLWALFYAVPAIWAGIAALRPRMLAGSGARALLTICLVGAVTLTFTLWPEADGWWRQEVWSMSLTEQRAAELAEASREGMGLMIVTAVLIVVLIASLARRPVRPRA